MKHKSIIAKLIIVLTLFGLCLFIFLKFNLVRYLNLEAMTGFLNAWGKLAAIIFILVFTARTLVFFPPYSVMVVLGGSIFGAFNGFIYSIISVFLSSTFAFFLSRVLGKEFVQKLLKDRVKKLDDKIEEHGFKIILAMRISVLFPYDILNYMAGLTKIKYSSFVLATVLGLAPETFSLTFLGNNIKNPFSFKFLIALILVLLTVTIPFIHNKMKKKM